MQYQPIHQRDPFINDHASQWQGSVVGPDMRLGGDAGRVDMIHNKLLQAAQRRDVDLLREILKDAMASLSAYQLDECLALHYAAWIKEVNDIVDQLIQMKCNPYKGDFKGDSVFHYAVKGCNLNFLMKMREREGTQIFTVVNHSLANIMLTAAAESPDDKPYEILRMMEWMYLQGSSIETQDIEGKSPLLWASKRGSTTVVDWLMSRGANLGHRDHYGNTVLHLACAERGSDDTVLSLCDRGAINLLQAESNDPTVPTPVQICVSKRSFFLALSLRLWSLHYKMFGRVTLFRTSYAWYYWGIAFLNLVVHGGMALRMQLAHTPQAYWYSLAWGVLWVMSQLCWTIAYLANPGRVKNYVIPNQFHRCSSEFKVDMNSPPVFPIPPDSASYELYRLEREMLRWSYALMKLNRKYRNGEVARNVNVLPHVEKQFTECGDRVNALKERAARLMERVGPERQAICPPRYVRHVMEGRIREVCLTCRISKPMRAHHCATCSKCIERFDHHCIWVDNCIGLGNQRSFFFFLTFLTSSLLYSYFYLAYFTYTHVLPADSTWLDALKDPLVLLGVLNSMLNLVWLGFVTFLEFRSLRSVFANVTFYESIKRPDHIKRRYFNELDRCCWYAADLSLGKVLRNTYAYFTLDMRFDSLDYPPAQRGSRPTGTTQVKTSRPTAPQDTPQLGGTARPESVHGTGTMGVGSSTVGSPHYHQQQQRTDESVVHLAVPNSNYGPSANLQRATTTVNGYDSARGTELHARSSIPLLPMHSQHHPQSHLQPEYHRNTSFTLPSATEGGLYG